MTFTGIDGCRAGWILIELSENDRFVFSIESSLEKLLANKNCKYPIYIDIPIGLADSITSRKIETLAKPMLAPFKQSSLFVPPCRDAVYAGNYQDAKLINLAQLEKSFSIQAWNICPKIKESDSFIQQNKSIQLREAHPELCFAALNNYKALQSKKSEKQGIEERIDLLTKYYKPSRKVFAEIMQKTKRLEVKADDIADALCLAVSAKIAENHSMNKIQGTHRYDSKGIEMALYYPQIG